MDELPILKKTIRFTWKVLLNAIAAIALLFIGYIFFMNYQKSNKKPYLINNDKLKLEIIDSFHVDKKTEKYYILSADYKNADYLFVIKK